MTDYSRTDYSDDGVDLTLIRWMLSLTPAERLQVLQRQVNAILTIAKVKCRTVISWRRYTPCTTGA